MPHVTDCGRRVGEPRGYGLWPARAVGKSHSQGHYDYSSDVDLYDADTDDGGTIGDVGADGGTTGGVGPMLAVVVTRVTIPLDDDGSVGLELCASELLLLGPLLPQAR